MQKIIFGVSVLIGCSRGGSLKLWDKCPYIHNMRRMFLLLEICHCIRLQKKVLKPEFIVFYYALCLCFQSVFRPQHLYEVAWIERNLLLSDPPVLNNIAELEPDGWRQKLDFLAVSIPAISLQKHVSLWSLQANWTHCPIWCSTHVRWWKYHSRTSPWCLIRRGAIHSE